MNRNTRTAVVVGVAVLLAVIASLGMYRIVSRMPATAAEANTVDVVVAQLPLKLGTRILADHVRVVRWPKDAPVEGAFSKIDDVLNRGVIAAVAMNEPLTGAKLAALEAGAGLPPSIPQGMRAISVKVNEVVGVAGFVVPGTRVDVMVTLKGRQDEQSMTRIVCSNVQVLTAGTRYDQEKAKEGNAIPSTVVTLLVKPDDGERIALAAEEGQLMLSLRNPLDVEPTITTGVKTAGLFGEAAPAPAKPRPAAARRDAKPEVVPAVAPPPEAPYRVEALKGGKRSEEVIKPSEVVKPSGGNQ